MPLARRCILSILVAVVALLLGGCQTAEPTTARALVRQQATVDLAGLRPAHPAQDIKATLSVPANWVQRDPQDGLFYIHQQWRSPSKATAIGVVYLHLPFPLSAKTLLELAKKEYTSRGKNGQILASWCDRYGRYWLEAQNDKYHGLAYILVDGLKAWVVYTGYERLMALDPADQALGRRSLQTVLPSGIVLAAAKAN